MIIKCRCSVYDREVAEVIGEAKAPSEWADFAFDTDALQGLRKGIHEGYEETYLYFDAESFVI